MNPLLPLEYFVPDGRLYLYGSYDICGKEECCSDMLHVFSTVFLFIRWIRRCPIGNLVAQAVQGMNAAKVIELLLHR